MIFIPMVASASANRERSIDNPPDSTNQDAVVPAADQSAAGGIAFWGSQSLALLSSAIISSSLAASSSSAQKETEQWRMLSNDGFVYFLHDDDFEAFQVARTASTVANSAPGRGNATPSEFSASFAYFALQSSSFGMLCHSGNLNLIGFRSANLWLSRRRESASVSACTALCSRRFPANGEVHRQEGTNLHFPLSNLLNLPQVVLILIWSSERESIQVTAGVCLLPSACSSAAIVTSRSLVMAMTTAFLWSLLSILVPYCTLDAVACGYLLSGSDINPQPTHCSYLPLLHLYDNQKSRFV